MQHYNKSSKMKDIRLRFRFDAKAEDNKMKSKSKQRVSSMTTKDENQQFSTVKQENDFNDSSWLAKLVNGIQENDNMDKTPLSEITNITSKNTSSLHTKKTSLNNIFTVQRKISQENIIIQKKCKILQQKEKSKSKENNKDKDKNQIKMMFQEKQNKKQSKKSLKNIMHNLTILNDKKTTDKSLKQLKKAAFLNKRNAKAHKNSLINYSSIKQEEMSIEKCSKSVSQNDLVIDLNDISLRTQFSKQNTPTSVQIRSRDSQEKYLTNRNTPQKIVQQHKEKVQIQTIQGAKRRRWSSHIASKTQEQSKSLISKETDSQIRDSSTPVKNLAFPEKIDTHKDNKITRMETNTPTRDLVSQNQFLDVFHNTNQITFIEAPIVKIGSIRKNKVSKLIPVQKVEMEKLELVQIKQEQISSQFKPPTFSQRPPHEVQTAKKEQKIGSRISHSSRNTFKCNDIYVSSVRKEPRGSNGLLSSNLYSASASKPTSIKYMQIFQKLDGKGEGIISKDNCNQMSLKREEKYEFGSILSKIKYLDLVLNKQNFIVECQKIHKALLEKENVDMDNLLRENKREIKQTQKIPLSADNAKVRKQLFGKGELVDFQGYDFLPLFPQNKDIYISNQIESDQRDKIGKQADQMRWMTNKNTLISQPQISEIGNKIDSLNSKLTKYIKNNDLEDTYSRFKLEFVELRKNMLN